MNTVKGKKIQPRKTVPPGWKVSDTLLRMSGGQLQIDPEKWLGQNRNLCPVVDVSGGERRML